MTSALPQIGKIAELLGGDVDDQSDFLATDTRGRAMSDRRITQNMPVELLRDARGIYGIGITESHDLEALAWSCGIDTEETYILRPPPTAHSAAGLPRARQTALWLWRRIAEDRRWISTWSV